MTTVAIKIITNIYLVNNIVQDNYVVLRWVMPKASV